MAIDYHKDSGILKALGHPVRLKIVEGLYLSEDCNVGDIVEKLGLPQSTVSQHLALLRHKGIIAPKKEGVRTCYRIADKRVSLLLGLLKKQA